MRDPSRGLRLFQLVGIQDLWDSALVRVPSPSLCWDPEVEEEIRGVPHSPRLEGAWDQDVGVDPCQCPIRPVKTPNVVPLSGKGEPDRVRTVLEGDLSPDL